MQGLASYVMRGRGQAVMATSVLGMFSIMLPPLNLLSSAAIGLVTLREGRNYGFQVAGLSFLVCAVMSFISLNTPNPALGMALLLWLPMIVTGQILRITRSLNIAVQAALSFGVLAIAFFLLQPGDPVAEWEKTLAPLGEQFVEGGLFSEPDSQQLIAELARWMTGFFAAGFFMQLVVSLFIARWWQAVLYNPGGFRQEFHQLRLHRVLGYLGAVLGGLSLLPQTADAGLLRYAMILLLAAYFLQGLATIHGIVGLLKNGRIWLIAVYALLLIAGPQMGIVIAMLGLADIWFDFRARAKARLGIDH